ncbi:preprotein translocase subunit SecE [Mycolicibacterium novocastrense]|uniref:preprotein translocase subunit SecE n=1 Tax=Mycolicibacterium novocastrense TaxID=59813 RepID=UPI0007498C24|nr:preprotein translocase subunit SecE [Mycolicibacterium novocastrense]KUH67908.1 preprotein translocase subunit SecE [Mycolicibacterium novocastrense]KUH68381.1 preprotein translocase subunit SecE [Mycolicibacterium novocastrense]KUH73460.1 preprotein translocase subunit SecE [Mycolicibacterium novocastrense]
MSDEHDDAGSDTENGRGAVVTRPTRPSGKRTRRAAAGEDASEAVDLSTGTAASPTKNGSGAAKKAAKKRADGPSRNPFLFVWNYLKQVVAELRKVIWPNRKQMATYTGVVLLFLAFMLAMIGGVDFGLAKLVSLVFG